MKANKQKIIDEIVLEIEEGKSYSETLAVNFSKWQLSERTFANYWNDANEAYKVILDNRRGMFENKTAQAYLEIVEKAILSRTQKLKILEGIIKGETTFKKYLSVNGKLERVDITPDVSDCMKAIEIHNKMQGDNAPDEIKTNFDLEFLEIDL